MIRSLSAELSGIHQFIDSYVLPVTEASQTILVAFAAHRHRRDVAGDPNGASAGQLSRIGSSASCGSRRLAALLLVVVGRRLHRPRGRPRGAAWRWLRRRAGGRILRRRRRDAGARSATGVDDPRARLCGACDSRCRPPAGLAAARRSCAAMVFHRMRRVRCLYWCAVLSSRC